MNGRLNAARPTDSSQPGKDAAGQAVIISIGDELLIGQVVNTNASFIARRLNDVGIAVRTVVTIGDDESQILKTFQECFTKFDTTIVTGGLGPTHDDITKKVLCRFFETDLVPHQPTLASIKSLFEKRNLPWTPAAEEQALVPRSCTVIPNKHGTAPGLLFERENSLLVSMPGVPHEMESMVDDFLVPLFRARNMQTVIRHRTLKTTGIPESFLATKLGILDDLLGGASLAFLPSPTGVRLRVTVTDTDAARAEQRVRDIENRIRSKVEKYVYGVDDEELEEVLGRMLTERRLTIAVAESCTGGLIASRITNVPGSSTYFERGVVAYSNRSKTDTLGVAQNLIDAHGAVSREVAEAMASGVRRAAHVDIGISTTGIAGPAGGTPQKPVGLVWVGFSDSDTTLAVKFHFGADRIRFKERASQAALELLRRRLLRLELPGQDNS